MVPRLPFVVIAPQRSPPIPICIGVGSFREPREVCISGLFCAVVGTLGLCYIRMRTSVLARASRVFVGATMMSLTVHLMYMSQHSWDFGAQLAGLPPLNHSRTTVKGEADRGHTSALESLQLAARQSARNLCQNVRGCAANRHLPLKSVDDVLLFLRDLRATEGGKALKETTSNVTVVDVAQTAASYFGVTRPSTDNQLVLQLARHGPALRFQTVIATAREDGQTLFTSLNALHNSGVYRDIQISWGRYESSNLLPAAVQASLMHFRNVSVSLLPKDVYGKVLALRRDRPWAFGHWLVHANYWQAFNSADFREPLLFLEDDILPASFFSLRLAHIVHQLNAVMKGSMYVLDLLVPYDWRDAEEVVPGVCLFEDVLKNFYGTQALFLSPGVSRLAATWYKMFAEGAPGTMGAGDMPVDLAFKEFLHAYRSNITVFAVKKSLVQHRCTPSTLKGSCWDAQNFLENSLILTD